MCKSPLHNLLTALPKCEHHVHLEGTLSPELLFELAAKNNIALPPVSSQASREVGADAVDPAFASPGALYARYAEFTSLDDFLHYYYIGFRVLLTASDFEALTYAYLRRAATGLSGPASAPRSSNVRHTEVFFDPQGHTPRGIPPSTIITGFHAAAARAERDFGITAQLIPCLLRHLPVSSAEETFTSLIDAGFFASGALAGLGLCSTELDRPPALYAPIFSRAAALGIRRTAHAGEEGPPGYVSAAVRELGVQRVDHGVRAAEEEGVMRGLREAGVLLTVCPLSNVALRGVHEVREVPVRVFLERGVKFSLNSDDPAYFGGYVQENYCAVEEAFGLSVGEWRTIARNAVEGSWCGEERKGVILREVEEVVREWVEREGGEL
ncbi:hypothetical protein B0T25DRAFT_462735 [Lasiosphaeria hispida]|uniref:Adenine deaminase n=1 Tax=Lasiosphaeria hispida TaxID=260671 RepID=A0AAJ0H9B7_9PEZI|nr:hypothetical protein B0T25DRAFT_462735 [Lasiosphaeria hispida]